MKSGTMDRMQPLTSSLAVRLIGLLVILSVVLAVTEHTFTHAYLFLVLFLLLIGAGALITWVVRQFRRSASN